MDKELLDAAAQFVHRFELVFDNDWEFTKTILENPEIYIERNGTFVRPNVEDEENNWANRARVLEAYRRLKALLEARGVALAGSKARFSAPIGEGTESRRPSPPDEDG